MKKVRIFVGLALVMIAGAAAATTALKQVNEEIYYLQGSSYLSAGVQSIPCSLGDVGCQIQVGSQSKQAYVFRSPDFEPLKND